MNKIHFFGLIVSLSLTQLFADPIPEGEAPARVRIGIAETEMDEDEANLTAEEQAAIQLALQGGGITAAAGNMIRSGMTITVNVLVQGRSEIRTDVQRINESGRIALPLIENVVVANQSMEQIEAQLTELYSQYFRNPHVIVEYVGSTTDPYMSPWGYVTMIGRVGSEGPIAIPPTRNMTLSGAIKSAGGLGSSANATSISVFRPNLEENRVRRISVDLRSVGRRGNHEEDILLKAGDVVFVPERIF
ncbi:MAG: polysaccharide biosynthesis/export family protein [Verrucomicrobia bacterium]|nr:polysaccharide biosynthesis/export family protein [Verrucomicrobiota bacterium]MCH8510704.1 polysaccharide biosynthesis/export family protein [Kiritimatiellia bacterium]